MSRGRIKRRQALRAAAALTAAVLTPTCLRAATGDLRVRIDCNGRAYDYTMAEGQDLGDFISDTGGFTQGCIRSARADFPMTVLFRPDRGGRRIEVVFELGRLWDHSAQNLGPYSATIQSGATVLAKVDVSGHIWFSRWRWQSHPRPVVADVNDLVARHLLPPLQGIEATHAASPDRFKGLPDSRMIKAVEAPPTAAGAALGLPAATGAAARGSGPYTIMGMAGLEPHMGATGERPDIGLLTEPQARYVCTGANDALSVVRAQAEAGGTCPWHMRDERTGAPVDLDAYPTMSWYDDPHVANPHIVTAGSDVQLDTAHEPALAYLPYLLTGDPYHLEDLQFASNWSRGVSPPQYRRSAGQTRAVAWYLRDLAQCCRVSPAHAPQWLMPKSYWDKELDRWLAFLNDGFVNDPSPQHAMFRTLEDPGATRDEGPTTPAGTHMPPWQSEFVGAVLGWMVLMGFGAWKPIFSWQIGSTLARTNGTSGWHRSHCTPYRIILRPSAAQPYVRSWAEAWALTARMQGWEPDPAPDTIVGQDLTYYFYTRGALAMANAVGLKEATAPLAWLDGQLQARAAVLPYKWRLA